MDKVVEEFEKRHRAVTAKHRKLADGYVTALNRNGTIEHKPIRRVPVFRLRTVLMALGVFLLFKGFILANLGVEDYESRLGHLATGSAFEQAGAWIMATDPASLWLSEKFQAFIS
ncbi:hypothetical protein [Salipiger aestuarii]|uniref:Uncharacterized protein n=1 Tax=Salipiger aestuarii TaxID=568098 RepID=A0A327Z154_9RHOB|nr:hypothetical protein [Salipiger aestuarii]EIE51142.1 hypothetical protein C357_09997 [Citreicella sp. 357]KAA8616021.1 hypothetical protein AL037_01980 [Salipiger aestuarii]KAB2543368.1 hypothetical protein AL035_02635 [Salipiger aestuarii]RAK23959.1 hypothetical protein ATI53_100166 [Salipiger aestuarii]